MQTKAAFLMGLICGTCLLLGPLAVIYVTFYDVNNSSPTEINSLTLVPASINLAMDKQLLPGETSRPESNFMRYVTPLNKSLAEVSLLYRVDIETEKQLSIQGSPTNYLDAYKNPCWLSTLPDEFPYSTNRYRPMTEVYPGGNTYSVQNTFLEISKVFSRRLKTGGKWRLRCLPQLYLVGVTKSGTTDLFEKMIKHRYITPGALKEPMWWNRHSIGRAKQLNVIPYTLSEYIDLYDQAAESIRDTVTETENGTICHPKITIDGTPAYLWDYDGWQMIPGNMGLQEPKYVMAHSLKALVPQANIIAIIRNPVERLYSQFRMHWDDASVEEFHKSVVAAVKLMKDCFDHRSMRSCVYDTTVIPTEFARGPDGNGKVFLRASMYYVFIADWLSVFSRDQMMILRAEDYYEDISGTLNGIYKFLDLPPMILEEIIEMNNSKPINTLSQNKYRSKTEMLAKTRTLLTNFFKPHNEQLAELLGDNRFLWTH